MQNGSTSVAREKRMLRGFSQNETNSEENLLHLILMEMFLRAARRCTAIFMQVQRVAVIDDAP